MKVLQIIPSISVVYGGPSQMVRGLSSALAAQGVDVTILTTDSNGDAGQPPLDVPLGQPVPEEGYTVWYFRCAPFQRYKFSTPLLTWLWQHAAEFDVAHIHALFSPVSSTAAVVARWRQLPYILRPLGTLDPADLKKKRQFKQLYAAILERPNLAGAAAIHFTSPEEARISERFGVETKDLVIPLGVYAPKAQKTETSSGPPLILFMSRIEPKKGLEILIQALEQVLVSGTSFRFVLAGSNAQDPDYENQIKQRIQQSPLNTHTELPGFVTGEAKIRLLQQADLFILPSFYENFGIAVAEAMVAGVPVIVSKGVQIWPEVEQADAGWVGTCDPESITTLIRTALENPAERKRRGHQARSYAMKNYSWDAIAQRITQAYEQITEKNRT
ncbi:MAG: hormogonium polysaccharide biosynthesis glycosyltransferase HpsP [Microcoleaceae cyanobacterium]